MVHSSVPRVERGGRARVALLALLAMSSCHRRARPRGSTNTLAADRLAVHADGQRGDITLRAPDGATLTFSVGETLPGHRPLRGAVVDASPSGDDAPDPLLCWRPTWIDAREVAHPLLDVTVRARRCAGGAGVEVVGARDGVSITHRVCVVGGGRFRAETVATGLPEGARLGDEINPGSAGVLVDARGELWEGVVRTSHLVVAERGVALVFEASEGEPAEARRSLVHIAAETFPAMVSWTAHASRRVRTLRVLRGDVLDALAVVAAGAGTFSLEPPPGGGSVEIVGEAGAPIARAELPAARRIALPPNLPGALRVRDAWGVAAPDIPLPVAAGSVVRVAPPASQTVTVEVTDEGGRAIPARVLLRGDGVADPALRLREGARGYAFGRSLYLTEGRGEVRLAPGRYHATVHHGLGWTLATEDLTVADAPVTLRAPLRAVVDETQWASADLHLHSAPSPDSRVSLEERVASLACNGVHMAVATDHNRITDFRPALASAGLGAWLTVVSGDEVTSAGASLWGHFNAFPLAVPEGAPERGALPYFEREPAAIFAAARAAGAAVVQVNHPRMPPRIGYFDLAGLDQATGEARVAIAGDINAVEAHNGIWLEQPERVREGLRDVIALARRGIRVAATGNSDSHRLLEQEAGYPRTWARVAVAPRETLAARVIDAIRRGDVTVSAGPLVDVTVDGARPGATVRAQGAVRVRARVIAPAWVPVERVEVWRDDVVVGSFEVERSDTDGVRWEGELTVPVTADASIVVWAEARRPLPDLLPYRDARAIGFSSPVWVDADGDGAVRLPPAAPANPLPLEAQREGRAPVSP